MNTLASVEQFINLRTIAVVGVSRNPKKFGNHIYKEMKKKGYEIYPVNSNTDEVEGERCYRSISDLPDSVGGVIINIPADKGKEILLQTKAKGIKNVWLQQGSSSKELVAYCIENNLNYVNNECIFMFAKPVESFHKFHRFIWKLIGKYPG